MTREWGENHPKVKWLEVRISRPGGFHNTAPGGRLLAHYLVASCEVARPHPTNWTRLEGGGVGKKNYWSKRWEIGTNWTLRGQELCESRGGRPGLCILMSLTVSVDVKQHWNVLRHWSQFVPRCQPTSEDMKLYIIIIITGQSLT